MLLDELRDRKAEISALAERYGARHIRVFGSGRAAKRVPTATWIFWSTFLVATTCLHNDCR